MSDEPTKTLYADVPRSLHKEARDLAYEQDRSLSSLVQAAVEEFIARHKAAHGKKVVA